MKKYFEDAIRFHQKGEFSSAVKNYQKINKLDVNYEVSQHHLGIILFEKGEYFEAYKIQTDLVNSNTLKAGYLNNRGNTLLRLDRVTEALIDFDLAIVIEPFNPEYLSNRSNAHFKFGNIDLAFRDLDQAISLDSKCINSYVNRSNIYYEINKFDAAMLDIQTAIALDSSNAHFYFNQGNIYTKQSESEKAIVSFQKACELDGTFIQAFLNLCFMLTDKQRYEEAINLMNRCLYKNPLNTDVMLAIGNIHLQSGDLEQAKLIFSSANKTLPSDLYIEYCLSAASGEFTPHISPLNFIVDLFNEYSSTYNEQMQNFLEYKSPANLFAQILRHQPHGFNQILDLGCGTGLVGKEFKAYSQSIDGVDISRNMLKEASHTKLYRSLYLDEMKNYLEHTEILYDLVVCADTLVYFGSLDELFLSIHKVISTHGYFSFTVENTEKEHYFLKSTKRFGHAISYLIELSEKMNFDILEFQKSVIRKEKSNVIYGYNVLMQKNLVIAA